MSKKSGWLITLDTMADLSYAAPSNMNAVGMMGPRGVTLTAAEIRQQGKRFRMFDDDGELYYEGYVVGNEEAPLIDFGRPNAGATEIKIYEGQETKEKWRTVGS